MCDSFAVVAGHISHEDEHIHVLFTSNNASLYTFNTLCYIKDIIDIPAWFNLTNQFLAFKQHNLLNHNISKSSKTIVPDYK